MKSINFKAIVEKIIEEQETERRILKKQKLLKLAKLLTADFKKTVKEEFGV